MRALKIAGMAAASAALTLALVIAALLWASTPQRSGEDDVAGLGGPVEIGFDDIGRPHVRAKTLEDAFAAQGWLHANDRLFQMELLRRAGRGHLSELFGPGSLEDDRMLWRSGVPQLARRLQASAGPSMQRQVDAYVAGINARIARYRVPPPEFLLLGHIPRSWVAEDVYAVGALVAFQTANNMQNEMVRLALKAKLDPERLALFLPLAEPGEDYPYLLGSETAMPGGEAALRAIACLGALDTLDNALMPSAKLGSNGWVVAPSRSATGTPLFAFDSHDDLGAPNLFYEINLSFGNGRSINGWSVPGLLGVINGYNDRIAWGLTNTGDTQDLFVEERSPDDPALFRQDGEWYRARLETVAIPLGDGESETLTIYHTHNGPLVSEEPALSLAWTGHRIGENGLDALIDINLARDWASFERAASRIEAPTTNATFADVEGTIGFRTLGTLPRRGMGRGLYPLSGADSRNAWQGLVSTNENPSSSNPGSGFLAAANARVSAEGNGPLVSADNAPAYRIARIRDVLSAKERLTVEDMRALQMEWHDTQAEWLLPAMLQSLEGAELSDLQRAALAELRSWVRSPVDAPDVVGPLVFQQWYLATADAVFLPVLGEELHAQVLKRNYLLNDALDRLIRDEPESIWWQGRRDALLAEAFRTAVTSLGAQLAGSPDRWRYGTLHTVGLRHELSREVGLLSPLFDIAPAAWGGGPATVGRASYRHDRPFAVSSGATVRVVGTMEPSGPRLSAIIPGGQSGHPLSRHYSDQHQHYLEGLLVPTAGGAEPTVTLRPSRRKDPR